MGKTKWTQLVCAHMYAHVYTHVCIMWNVNNQKVMRLGVREKFENWSGEGNVDTILMTEISKI